MSNIIGKGIVLTVSEGKRLIAKAVANHPYIKEKMKKGMIVIAKGTTNAYVVEELLNKKIELSSYGSGVLKPKKKALKPKKKISPIPDIVLKDGEIVPELDRFTAVKEFTSGDVYIKGANALDYKNKKAGILIGAENGGTIGSVIGDIMGKRAQLFIPVGLEKIVYEDIDKLHLQLQQPHSHSWRIFPVTGEIITEIEALKILCSVDATLAAAGGIAGAEGCIALYMEANQKNIDKAEKLLDTIYGEPQIV